MNNRLTLDYGMRFVHQQPQVRDERTGVQFPAGGARARRGAPALRRGARMASTPVRGPTARR